MAILAMRRIEGVFRAKHARSQRGYPNSAIPHPPLSLTQATDFAFRGMAMLVMRSVCEFLSSWLVALAALETA